MAFIEASSCLDPCGRCCHKIIPSRVMPIWKISSSSKRVLPFVLHFDSENWITSASFGRDISRDGFEMYLRDLVWRQMLNLLTMWVVVTFYRGGCRGLMMVPLTALIRVLIKSFEHLRCLLSIYLPVSLLRVAKDVCSLVSL